MAVFYAVMSHGPLIVYQLKLLLSINIWALYLYLNFRGLKRNGNWHPRLEKLYFAKKPYQRKFDYFQQDEMFLLFDSMVKPTLCYGSEVWGTDYSDVIESVHFNFCKYF